MPELEKRLLELIQYKVPKKEFYPRVPRRKIGGGFREWLNWHGGKLVTGLLGAAFLAMIAGGVYIYDNHIRKQRPRPPATKEVRVDKERKPLKTIEPVKPAKEKIDTVKYVEPAKPAKEKIDTVKYVEPAKPAKEKIDTITKYAEPVKPIKPTLKEIEKLTEKTIEPSITQEEIEKAPEKYQEIVNEIEGVDFTQYKSVDSLINYLEKLVKVSRIPLPNNFKDLLYISCNNNAAGKFAWGNNLRKEKWFDLADKINRINESLDIDYATKDVKKTNKRYEKIVENFDFSSLWPNNSGHEKAERYINYLEKTIEQTDVPLRADLHGKLYTKCINYSKQMYVADNNEKDYKNRRDKWLSLAEKIRQIETKKPVSWNEIMYEVERYKTIVECIHEQYSYAMNGLESVKDMKKEMEDSGTICFYDRCTGCFEQINSLVDYLKELAEKNQVPVPGDLQNRLFVLCNNNVIAGCSYEDNNKLRKKIKGINDLVKENQRVYFHKINN